jgi:hypothetical protein
MRGSALAAATSLLVVLGFAPRAALAASPVAYTYEIENADSWPDKVLVLWPRTCQASGKPLGAIDLALNPDWAPRMHEIDYEVVVKGKAHGVVRYCVESARFFALPASDFALGARASTADDMAIGQVEAGAPFAIVPALDAVDLKKRVELFGADPRVLRASFRFDAPVDAAAPEAAAPGAAVRAVHDVLAVSELGPTGFVVSPKRVVYTYQDGATETLAYVGASRPGASRSGAASGAVSDGGAFADAAAESGVVADAGASADGGAFAARGGAEAGVGEAASAGAPADRGTRFVYLAAVAGLVSGGLLALYRKKRERR